MQVGALQDVRAELAKLCGVLFSKVTEDLHLHLYNRGDYRCVSISVLHISFMYHVLLLFHCAHLLLCIKCFLFNIVLCSYFT